MIQIHEPIQGLRYSTADCDGKKGKVVSLAIRLSLLYFKKPGRFSDAIQTGGNILHPREREPGCAWYRAGG